jgi:hypothetical protein
VEEESKFHDRRISAQNQTDHGGLQSADDTLSLYSKPFLVNLPSKYHISQTILSKYPGELRQTHNGMPQSEREKIQYHLILQEI